MSPLREFKTCSRVGGPVQKCSLCGRGLMLECYTAVQMGGTSAKPVFANFCHHHPSQEIRAYVLAHQANSIAPAPEEETP